jgi:hypothetical protein
MTINEAIYQVLEGMNISTDDFPASKRFVYGELLSTRSELIKQELNKNVLLDSGSMQSVQCFKLIRTDASVCPDCTSGDYVLQSVEDVPEALEYKSGRAIFVYLMNGVPVNKLDKDLIAVRHRRRYKLPGSFGYIIRNRKLIIIGYDDIDELDVSLEGHFEKPELVASMNESESCDDDKCKPAFEYEFICPGHIERRVIEIAKLSVGRKLGIPSDNSNNAQFDPNVKSQS